jgi:hypothetical protein
VSESACQADEAAGPRAAASEFADEMVGAYALFLVIDAEKHHGKETVFVSDLSEARFRRSAPHHSAREGDTELRLAADTELCGVGCPVGGCLTPF